MHTIYHYVWLLWHYTGSLYVPTIVNACASEAGESFRLNVEWKVCTYIMLHIFNVCSYVKHYI